MKTSVFRQLVKISNKKIFLIVEMSGNHQGSLSGAKKFINTSIKFGADIIKFQVYTPDTITLKTKKKIFYLNQKINGKNTMIYIAYIAKLTRPGNGSRF